MTYLRKPLGHIAKVVGGYAFRSSDFTGEGVPVIRISDIFNGTVSVLNASRIEKQRLGNGVNYRVEPGDVLIAMSGATTGKIGVVPEDVPYEVFQNQRVGNFKILDPSQYDKSFLKF